MPNKMPVKQEDKMDIRRAISQDSLLLSSLCMDVQRLHAEHHPNLFKMPQTDDFAVPFFDEILAGPYNVVFLAEENGQALGYMLCKMMERPETIFTFATRYVLVDQISVRPAAQGRGVGKALMEQVVSLSKELNMPRIQLDSWGFNTEAHAFFERMGFEKFNHRFWRNL
jgi:ribosomal protein S18 acetylase RimI-like enzyme